MQIQITVNDSVAIDLVAKNDLVLLRIEYTFKSSGTYPKVLKNECFSFNKHVRLFPNLFN
jgi:hypothetical protein